MARRQGPPRERARPGTGRAGPRRTLERGVRLSASRLWALQRAFFARQDPLAWTLGPVPSDVTTSASNARAHARVVAAFLEDCADGRLGRADDAGPVTILELGAGSGRFAFRFLRELEARLGPEGQPRARYVVTDFDPALVEALRSNPAFAGFVKRGRLDFAVLDAQQPPERIALLEGGGEVRAAKAANPLVVLANYVLDGLPADAFEVRGGQLHESLVRLEGPEGASGDDPAALPRLSVGFERGAPVEAPYGDAAFDALLREHAARATDGHVLFPIAGLRLLRRLQALAGDRLLVLAADRGHVHEEALMSLEPPRFQHHGSFSLDVNFHALAQHARATGGLALLPAHHPTHLATVGLLWGCAEPGASRTAQAFAEAMAEGGPEDLFLLQETLQGAPPPDLEHALAWLRATAWDFEVFLHCLPGMLRSIGEAGAGPDEAQGPTPLALQDALDAARRVRDGYYWVKGDRDVAGALGELFEALDAMAEAAAAYQQSIQRSGPTAATLHRLAVCKAAGHRNAEALAAVEQALAIDPRHEPARALRLVLLAEMRRGGGRA